MIVIFEIVYQVVITDQQQIKGVSSYFVLTVMFFGHLFCVFSENETDCHCVRIPLSLCWIQR